MTGTRNLTRHGYVRVHAPDHPMAHRYGWVYEHRMVAYDAGLLELDDRRQVHHKNHDRTDNRLENLEVLTSAEHRREHRTIDRARAVEMYVSGMTTMEVGKRLHVNPATISRLLAAAGVSARPVDLRFNLDEDLVERMVRFGIPQAVVASHFGCAEIVIGRIKRERSLPARRTGRPHKSTPTIADFMAAAS